MQCKRKKCRKSVPDYRENYCSAKCFKKDTTKNPHRRR